VGLAALVLAPGAALDHPHSAPTLGAVGAVVVLGLLCTALAFVIFTVLISEAGTSRATVITYVNPVVAVTLGVALLGERPGVGAVAGLLLILAGSWLSTDGRLPPPLRGVFGGRRGSLASEAAGSLPSASDGGNDPRCRAGVHLHRPDLPGADALG
jgi:hypothetical protein